MGHNAERRLNLLVITAIYAGKLLTLFREGMETLYDGVIPPLLGYERLQELIDADYGTNQMYMTESHNNSGFYSWELRAIEKYVTPGSRFMVLAAGGGREVLALLQKGVHVEAWECNAALCEYGNRLLEREGHSCRIKPVEPSKCPSEAKNKNYDFCIVGWSAYCHILRREDRINLLAGIREAVNGPVLISFVTKGHIHGLKRTLRRLVSCIPGSAKNISLALVASPGNIREGFDEKDISEEAQVAGFVVSEFVNHRPEYPYAILSPKSDGSKRSPVPHGYAESHKDNLCAKR
jgi:hypothetical protein